MIPKFLLADNSQELPDTIFIVHTEEPRFILECDIEDFNENQIIHWIDAQPKDTNEIEDLVDEAEVFLENELENEEDLYDEDEANEGIDKK